MKSKYDSESKHFNFELKFDGPSFEGSYFVQNNASDSRFDVDFDGSLNFKVKAHPGSIKIGWTFASNETTHKLSIHDLKFEIFPIYDSKKSFIYKLDEEIPKYIDDSPENALSTFDDEFNEIVEELKSEFIKSFLDEILDDFESVDELSSSLLNGFKSVFAFGEKCQKI